MPVEQTPTKKKRKYTPRRQPEVLDNGYQRQARIGNRVTVVQRTSFGSSKWEKSEVFWSSPPGADAQGALEFASDITKAATLAIKWNQERAGKVNEKMKRDTFTDGRSP